MNLLQWLRVHDYDPDKVLCVSVGTDGIKPDSKIMSVSYRSKKEEGTVYIRGAAAEKVEPYTGVAPLYYANNAVGPARAIELLAPVFQDVSFLVTYYAKFHLHQLRSLCYDLVSDKEYIDVVAYLKMLDSGQRIAHDIDSVTLLQDRLTAATGYITKKGYALDDLCKRLLPDGFEREGPALENKVHYLYGIYTMLLIQ